MEISITLTGRTPLVMHNPRLANPADPIARAKSAIAIKRKKTDADYADIARLEWEGGIHTDVDGFVALPTWNVVRALEDAAKADRRGTALVRALTMLTLTTRIQVDGKAPVKPKQSADNTWTTTVGQQKNRVVRTRPIWRNWALEVRAELAEDELNVRDLAAAAERAGRLIGLGDARKLGYGRFEAVVSAA